MYNTLYLSVTQFTIYYCGLDKMFCLPSFANPILLILAYTGPILFSPKGPCIMTTGGMGVINLMIY